MGLILREMGSRGEIKGCREDFPKAPIEKGPHTCLKSVSGKVTGGSNPTSTCRVPKVEELGGYVGGLFMIILL